MERKDFLKNSIGFLGMALISPSLLRSNEDTTIASAANGTASCAVSNSETAGPFPTITPASLVNTNISGDRTGVDFTMNIVVKNVNNSCGVLENAIVDIWHCDREGNYSEYGGTQMQTTNYTSAHFLRGRQTSDANGLVKYTSKFPGWYTGRATHIHVHIYNSTGSSLLITQIAFPEGSGSAVETVNAATSYGYTKGMTGYTYNASDNVFSDGVTSELSTITGNVSDGYVLNFEAFVSGAAGGTATGMSTVAAESQFQVKQNYPNPAADQTTVPFVLRQPSDVSIYLLDMQGKQLKNILLENLPAGAQESTIDLSGLGAGRYVYSVEIKNSNGTFKQSKILLKN